MFDISFSELLLIAVVALIVLGPERLPKVARTVGHLMGRAQRYMNEVKTDIQREIDLEEINKLKNQMHEAAQSIRNSVDDGVKTLKDPLDEAQKAISDLSTSVADRATTTQPVQPAKNSDVITTSPEHANKANKE